MWNLFANWEILSQIRQSLYKQEPSSGWNKLESLKYGDVSPALLIGFLMILNIVSFLFWWKSVWCKVETNKQSPITKSPNPRTTRSSWLSVQRNSTDIQCTIDCIIKCNTALESNRAEEGEDAVGWRSSSTSSTQATTAAHSTCEQQIAEIGPLLLLNHS